MSTGQGWCRISPKRGSPSGRRQAAGGGGALGPSQLTLSHHRQGGPQAGRGPIYREETGLKGVQGGLNLGVKAVFFFSFSLKKYFSMGAVGKSRLGAGR